MTADLAVLVPSRGRPASVGRLVRACALTCEADTGLHFGFDEDDPQLQENLQAAAGWPVTVLPRMGLAAWTNRLAAGHTQTLPELKPRALASIGDDMLPVTAGWDRLLLDALPAGGGFCYPNDKRRDDIPEAVVISTPIVEALGWMALPQCAHWFIDNVWADLGRAAGCLVYCPDVTVEHLHPNVRPDVARPDATYHEAAGSYDADLAAYQRWRLRRMRADAAAVRRVREAAAHPV